MENAVLMPHGFDVAPDTAMSLKRYVENLAASYGQECVDIEDIVQETIVRAHFSEGVTSPNAWLRVVARSILFSLIRTSCYRRKKLGPRVSLAAAHVPIDGFAEAHKEELNETLELAIETLPANLRLIVELKMNGQSYASIGNKLQMHKKAVERRFQEACKHLRKFVGE